MFYAWLFNLWLFAYFPLQRERQILWRILAANLLYKMKIQCGDRGVYICFDSCLEIKWLHLERCPSFHFLVPISFSPYPRSLVTILPKSAAHWSPPVAFPPLRGGSAASLMTFISCPNIVCATHTGETGLGLARIFIKAKQARDNFGTFNTHITKGYQCKWIWIWTTSAKEVWISLKARSQIDPIITSKSNNFTLEFIMFSLYQYHKNWQNIFFQSELCVLVLNGHIYVCKLDFPIRYLLASSLTKPLVCGYVLLEEFTVGSSNSSLGHLKMYSVLISFFLWFSFFLLFSSPPFYNISYFPMEPLFKHLEDIVISTTFPRSQRWEM